MSRKNRRRSISRRGKGGFLKKFFITFLVVLICTGAVAGYILFETEKPTFVLKKELKYLGANVEFPFAVTDSKSGLRTVEITLEQKGKSSQLFNRSFQRKSWLKDAGPKKFTETLSIDAKKAKFKDGDASLIIRVRDFSLNSMLRGNETVETIPVIIDTKPPKVNVNHSQQYIRPGGSGIVLYRLSEPADKHGVVIDELFFKGFPLSAGSKNYISYICLPWNSDQPEISKVIAVDEAGNVGKSTFSMNFKAVKDKKDRINVGQGFLKSKIPEFEERIPNLTGSMLEKYIYINNNIRKENADTIMELCSTPESKRHWRGRFNRMPGANKAGYADQRTYFNKGAPIDHQTHLGIDIASTARADVRAANKGKIVYADYLGIYGNMIIIDHGQGVFSLYSHLSRIDTEVGMMVESDQHIGNTGNTGMAGGDHLHFSMLVHGIFVSPIEWWDQHWIDVNIDAFIGSN